MHLIFRQINNWITVCASELGCHEPPTSRIVTIELTEEQKELLTPCKVGSQGTVDIFETLEFLCVEERDVE